MIQVSALLCLPFACLCFLCPGGLLIWIGAFPCGFCRRFFVCLYWITGCPACRTTGRGGVVCNAVVGFVWLRPGCLGTLLRVQTSPTVPRNGLFLCRSPGAGCGKERRYRLCLSGFLSVEPL